MKKNTQNLIVLFVLMFTQSCGLLGDEDDFSCTKNAPLKKGGKDICATAIIDEFKQDNDTPSEHMNIRFVFGTGSFEISLTTTEIQAKEYAYPGEANLWFAEINKSGTGTITITSIDRSTNSISGLYNLSAEGASNFQAYQYEVAGTFTDVSF